MFLTTSGRESRHISLFYQAQRRNHNPTTLAIQSKQMPTLILRVEAGWLVAFVLRAMTLHWEVASLIPGRARHRSYLLSLNIASERLY